MIDPKDYPPDRLAMTREQIQQINPHRHEFAQLDGVLYFEPEDPLFVALREVAEDEFWVRGHVPGRPIFPGVLMCETLAQAASVHAQLLLKRKDGTFFGFAAMDEVRFKDAVEPGTTLWVAGKLIKLSDRHDYFKWHGQLLREDGSLVCTAIVTGKGL